MTDALRQRLASLSPRQRAALEARLTPRQARDLPPAATEGPLTPAQADLLERLEERPETSACYNLVRALRLRGPLDDEALRRALQGVLDRHPALRLRRDGSRARAVPAAIPWRRLEVGRQDLPSFLAEEAARPFDLATPPLVRATLARLDRQEHVLAVSVHHLAADCWSLGPPCPGPRGGWVPGPFFADLFALYVGRSPGPVASALDFARQQADWLESPEGRRQQDWWRDRLAGLGAPSLPWDLPYPAHWSHEGLRHPLRLPGDPLRQRARATGATTFEVLAALWAAFLGRWSGAAEVCLGTPVAGRSRERWQGVVGWLGNQVPLRLTGDLEQAIAACRQAWARAEVPLDTRASHFAARLVLHRAGGRPTMGGLQVEALAVERPLAKHPLTLLLVDEGEGDLEGWLEGSLQLFRPDTLARLAADLGERAARPEGGPP